MTREFKIIVVTLFSVLFLWLTFQFFVGLNSWREQQLDQKLKNRENKSKLLTETFRGRKIIECSLSSDGDLEIVLNNGEIMQIHAGKYSLQIRPITKK